MKTVKINSVADYVNLVCQSNKEMKENGKKGDILLFRGQADMENELIPSLGRKGANGRILLEEESNMIEMARYKLPTVFKKDLEPLEMLALLQHHGIPTRLLDVSENALVGLYFACHDSKTTEGKDGEVIVFKNNDMDIANYPMVNKICETYRSRKEKTQDELQEMKDMSEKVVVVYAPSYSLRQNIQRGRYILFTNKIEKTQSGLKMVNEIDAVSKEEEPVVIRILVPSECKRQIRRDLRLLGVSKELLFLDNADMVCKEIADRFGER